MYNIRHHDRPALKAAAREALDAAPGHKKLVLLWAGVTTALSLAVCIITFLLDNLIADTGGLSGIGLRSTLSTAQSALTLASALLIPFWDIGYTVAVLRLSRQESATPHTLLEGFRHFGPVLRLFLLRYMIYSLIAVVCVYAGIIVLSMTPLAMPVYTLFTQHQEVFLSGVIDDATAQAFLSAMTPVLIGCSALCAAVLIPITYKLRLSEYLLIDQPGGSALAALAGSWKRMKKNSISLFRLDLSFWWYYLAQLLLTALCYGDTILPSLGISLPFDQETAYFVFYLAALAGQLGLFYAFSNQVQVTYAKFYDALTPPPAPTDIAIT